MSCLAAAQHCFGSGKWFEAGLYFSSAEPVAGLGLAADCTAVVPAVPASEASVAKCVNARIARFPLAGDSSAAVSAGPLKAVRLVVPVFAGNGAAAEAVAALGT